MSLVLNFRGKKSLVLEMFLFFVEVFFRGSFYILLKGSLFHLKLFRRHFPYQMPH